MKFEFFFGIEFQELWEERLLDSDSRAEEIAEPIDHRRSP